MDGMAVTAHVWEEAHDFHRIRQRFHDLLQHGPGIVVGLQVSASDPPDSAVYIQPGVAIDPGGDVIVVPEQLSYDFGSTEGLLYLVISYGETRPTQGKDGGLLYIQSQYEIEAVPTLPASPCVELARVFRAGEILINDAKQADLPGSNELDLRFRPDSQSIADITNETARIAVCYAGLPHPRAGHGAVFLARALRHAGRQVWVDDEVPFGPGLGVYTLVYLVGAGSFQLTRQEMNTLYAYLNSGGTLILEGCHQGLPSGNSLANAAFSDLAASFGISLAEPQEGDPLLVEPNLFGAPPPGYQIGDDQKLLIGNGLIFSTCDYGCLWQGKRHGRAASREEIRSGEEWGENLLDYALNRWREARSR